MHLHWPSLPQALLLLILGVVMPSMDSWWRATLRRHPTRRRLAYQWMIAGLWALTSAAWVSRGAGFTVAHAAGEPAWMLGRAWQAVLAIVLVTFVTGAVLSSGVRCLWQPRLVPAYTRAHAALAWFLPHTLSERRWWVLVSVTAGVTEEWIFRGYVLHALHHSVGSSLTVAMVLSSALFGLGHLYQGWRGASAAGVLGFAFAMLAVLTGGLLVPMLVHTLIDLQVLVIFRPDPGNAAASVAPALANPQPLNV